MKEYNTYLFDVDGTLIDTAELIYQCFKYSVPTFTGKNIDRETVMHHIGLPFRAQLEQYAGPLSDSEVEHIFTAHMKFQQSVYTQYLAVFDGIIHMLTRIKESGKNLGIVTSRKKDSLNRYLKHTNLDQFFTVKITPEDTQHHKPHPEPIERALEELKTSSENAVYIGDSVFDIESGHRAHCDTIFVSWSHVDHTACHISPTHVVGNPAEIF